MLSGQEGHPIARASASSSTPSRKWLDAGEKHLWSKIRVSREMPNKHCTVKGHASQKFVQDLVLKAPEVAPC